MNLDLRIAYAIANRANNYIKKQNIKKKKIEEDNWNNLFGNNTSFVGKLNDKLQINFYKDSILSNLIYTGFEQDEIIFLRKFLKPADTFIDIGANIGLFSLHAAQIISPKGRIYAFEPTPITFSRLKENIELNEFQNIITAYNIGLSSNKGKLFLNVSTDGHDAWNTFAQNSEISFDKKIEINVTTLDSYLAENNIYSKDIALIKMDVEGWEMEVLKGAKELLSKQDAPVFMVEFTESNLFAAGTNCYELYDNFVSFGYKWYVYNSKNNTLTEDTKRLHYPYVNLIATKNVEQVLERLK